MRALQKWLYRRLLARPISPRQFLRYSRWYAPLLFQRIVPLAVSNDFLSVHVKIKKSFLNRNLHGSCFGGTLMTAVDPWYGLLLWQKCQHIGLPLEVWVEAMEIHFLKAGWGDLYVTFWITPQAWEEIYQALTTEGKLRYTFSFQVYGSEGHLCAEGVQRLYLRNLALCPRQRKPATQYS